MFRIPNFVDQGSFRVIEKLVKGNQNHEMYQPLDPQPLQFPLRTNLQQFSAESLPDSRWNCENVEKILSKRRANFISSTLSVHTAPPPHLHY